MTNPQQDNKPQGPQQNDDASIPDEAREAQQQGDNTAQQSADPQETLYDDGHDALTGGATSQTDASPEIDQLKQALSDSEDRMKRALAEAENARRRAQKDRDEAGKYAVSSFARDLLDFSDNFTRALGAIPDESRKDDKVKTVMEGIDAMQRDLMKVFDRHGIQKIEPMGEVFDPNFHEVMFEAPEPNQKAGTVIQVIEPGYVLNGRLLRAAKVGIAKGGDTAPTDSQIDQQA